MNQPANAMTGKTRSSDDQVSAPAREPEASLAGEAHGRHHQKDPVLTQEGAAGPIEIRGGVRAPEHARDGHDAPAERPPENDERADLEPDIEGRPELEERVACGAEAREQLAGGGPDRRRVVAVVLLHVLPVAAARHALEPRDVFLERGPLFRREALLALRRILEDVRLRHRADQVHGEIADLTLRDLRAASVLDLGDHRALVEVRVAERVRVLRPEVVVIKFVPVVVVDVANVRIEEVEVREEADDGERDPDAPKRAFGKTLSEAARARFDEQ